MPNAGDIEVEMTFLTTEEGGRHTPARQSYRSQFFYDEQDWVAVYTFIDTDRARPGETVRAFVSFASPDAHAGHVHPGLEFLVHEGTHTVAHGRVLRVVALEERAVRIP